MQIRIAKSQREDKTAYVAVRAGEMTGFAAVRYDLRSLLRYAGVTLAASKAASSPPQRNSTS